MKSTSPLNEGADTCVFCKKIADNDIEAHADDMVIFTPLNPVVPGHKLFVHTKHTTNASAEPVITGKLFEYASYYGKGRQFNLITSAGKDATQTIMHTHIHFVPRHKDDGLLLPWSSTATAERAAGKRAIALYKLSQLTKDNDALAAMLKADGYSIDTDMIADLLAELSGEETT